MNTAQVWTVLGILAVSPVLTTTVIVLFIGANIDGALGKLDAKIDGLDAKFTQRFNAIDKRIDLLDHDVQAVIKRVFRDGDT